MKPGDTVTWKHSPRGGWGYVFRVDAVILTLDKTPDNRRAVLFADLDRGP